ncbi:SPOC like C-terminal domain-containing protein [Infundibulicybe gibba]|nr:SPOC like C-terminal domain-containing protein [Infundibulicybe gibba]
MAPYDDWNKIDDQEDEELQDASHLESRRDVIVFCIDCSPSMLELRDDPEYEDTQTCHLYTALDAAMQIQKRKVIVGPNDSVGILLFNTTKTSQLSSGRSSEIKKGTFLYQAIKPVGAPQIQELIQLLDAFREDPNELSNAFPPLKDKRIPMGDVFTSCNWVLRDGAPKTASKRVFLITDEDDPHSGPGNHQLVTSARTTLIDLTQAGATVEPFFISSSQKPFEVSKFYSSVLLPNNVDEEAGLNEDSSILPESISIARIGDLLDQMRIHEVPKRAQFSVSLELAEGFKIGVKGYGLVTEQKKGSYKYFVDLGDRMEVATARTVYIDQDREAEVDKSKIVYGTAPGASAAADGEDEEDESVGTRVVKEDQRPFYSAEEVRSFRTLGLEPSIKLLGFKDRSELVFEDNVKHSHFIYPDEMTYSGSKRTFSALLKSMVKKKKIGLALTLTRRNASPAFCVLLPQEEKVDEGGWTDPAGFHLVPLPFADDIRAAPVEEGYRASDDLKDAARAWIDKLSVKNGAYPPDAYPNPALGYHNAQLQASAFREQYDPDSFEDLTEPKIEMIHKRAGKLIKSWKLALLNDESADVVVATTGSKRKADVGVDEAEIRSQYDGGALAKVHYDNTADFLKSKSQPVSGKKAELIERVADWLDTH